MSTETTATVEGSLSRPGNGPTTRATRRPGLAAELALTTASTTTVVDRLAAIGPVRRRPAATDRRVVVEISGDPTGSGLDALAEIVELICARVEGNNPADRAAVARFLDDVLTITEAHARAGGVAPSG